MAGEVYVMHKTWTKLFPRERADASLAQRALSKCPTFTSYMYGDEAVSAIGDVAKNAALCL